MSDQKKTAITFILGAAAGIAVGYFLASDNKAEIIGDLKDSAHKMKDELENQIERGKKFVDHLKNKVSDLLENE